MLEGEGKPLYLQDEDICSSGNVENSAIGFGFFLFPICFSLIFACTKELISGVEQAHPGAGN